MIRLVRLRSIVLAALVSTCWACSQPTSLPTEPGITLAPIASPTSGSTPQAAPAVGKLLSKTKIDGLLAVTTDGTNAWITTSLGGVGSLRQVDGASGGLGPAYRVGWFPVALAIGERSIWVCEGPGDGSRPGSVQNRVDRIDPKTGTILATVSVRDPTDIVVGSSSAWVVTSQGLVLRLSPSGNEIATQTKIEGSGPARVAFIAGSVWVVNGQTEPQPRTLVHRIDPATSREVSVIQIPAGGTGAFIAGLDNPWIAVPATSPGRGKLLQIDAQRNEISGASFDISSPTALTTSPRGQLWWSASDGSVGALSRDSGPALASLRVGDGAYGIAAGSSLVWAIVDDALAEIKPG